MRKECKIIAEAGVNHNGSMETAFALVDAACQAGADYVKFQTFRADRLVTRFARTADYQRRNLGGADSQYEMLKKLELPDEGFRELAGYCAKKGIGFLSTPFDIESARFLAGLGMPAMKVSSGDLTNLPLLRELAGIRLPVILSTGMATLGEVEASIDVLDRHGLAVEQLSILHCTTEYPAPFAEINLRVMQTFRAAFPFASIGYSDHTEGIAVSFAAAALGAEWLEKHVTLDRSMPGPDHRASIEPDELKALVRGVRQIGLAMGDGRKNPSASELNNAIAARKSIIAASPIVRGEPFSERNLTVQRPGNGISPMLWDALMGKPAMRDYDRGELIDS
jgi:N-acetylneuraminate synthase